MSLTAKQESFAQLRATGVNRSDAYRAVADVGENTTESSIWESASRMDADVKVMSRITQLKDEIAAQSLWTRLDSVTVLKTIAHDAETKANDKTGAVKVLNEMHGYNAPVKIEHSGTITKIELVSLDNDIAN